MQQNPSESLKSAHRESGANRGNADYDWNAFDSESYFQHYYGEPHPDDDAVIACAVAALQKAAPHDRALDIVDVGTGPNLIPFMCALPRARSLTAWEYAASNVAWLKRELATREMRPQWRHFWNVTRQTYGDRAGLPENPLADLARKSRIEQGSIFELPERRWDAATMFFCAESITGDRHEFDRACRAFARCVKPGGLLAAAFLVRSAGYIVANRDFPVLHLDASTIEAVFARDADAIDARSIGLVEREIRSGYAGFVFLTGRAR